MLTVRDAINEFLLRWLFCADAAAGDREPLVTLAWLVLIFALAIAALLTVCVWPLGDEFRSRRSLRDAAKALPPMPSGSLTRERGR